VRIVFINSVRTYGGGVSSTLDLAIGLAHAGHEITVVCNPRSPLHQKLIAAGIRAAPQRMRSDFGPLAATRLARIMAQAQADVVLADRRKDVKLAVLARLAGGRVPLVHRHGAPSPLRNSAIYRFFWRRVHALVVNSFAMQKQLVEHAPWLGCIPIHVIHNGIDLERFRPMPELREGMRNTLAIPGDAFVIAYHGVLQERKRVAVLIRAAAALPAALRAHVLVIGDGPDLPQLRNLAATSGVSATFTGTREDIPRLLAAADVYTHLSAAEGFANSVVEALACGLPVLASSAASHPEQIDDGRNGLLVDPDRQDLVSGALQHLAGDSTGLEAMGLAARAAAERRFDRRLMVTKYESVLDSVARKHPAT
jgi:glycosyltransferase involved in cell wall biosynthesis